MTGGQRTTVASALHEYLVTTGRFRWRPLRGDAPEWVPEEADGRVGDGAKPTETTTRLTTETVSLESQEVTRQSETAEARTAETSTSGPDHTAHPVRLRAYTVGGTAAGRQWSLGPSTPSPQSATLAEHPAAGNRRRAAGLLAGVETPTATTRLTTETETLSTPHTVTPR